MLKLSRLACFLRPKLYMARSGSSLVNLMAVLQLLSSLTLKILTMVTILKLSLTVWSLLMASLVGRWHGLTNPASCNVAAVNDGVILLAVACPMLSIACFVPHHISPCSMIYLWLITCLSQPLTFHNASTVSLWVCLMHTLLLVGIVHFSLSAKLH